MEAMTAHPTTRIPPSPTRNLESTCGRQTVKMLNHFWLSCLVRRRFYWPINTRDNDYLVDTASLLQFLLIAQEISAANQLSFLALAHQKYVISFSLYVELYHSKSHDQVSEGR